MVKKVAPVDNVVVPRNSEGLEATPTTEKVEPTGHVHKEGGYGWVVVIATGYCFGVLISMVNTYALVVNELNEVYESSDNHVLYSAWIGSAQVGVQYFFCSLGSILSDMYGPRIICAAGGLISCIGLLASVFVTNIKIYFITYSCIMGFGQALVICATLAILPHYFEKKLAFANGLMGGIGAFMLVGTPILVAVVLEKWSLDGAWYFFLAINAGTILAALTYKPQIQLKSFEEDKSHKGRFVESIGLSLLKKKKLLFWFFASFFASFGWLIPIILIDHHAIHEFPDINPVVINIVFGTCNGLGALISGKIGDLTLGKLRRVHFHTIGYGIYGLFQISLPWSTNFYMFITQMVVLGLIDGMLLGYIGPIGKELADSSQLANHAAGYYHVAIVPSTVAGPAIAGALFEHYHNYDVAFYFGGTSCLFASALLILGFNTVFKIKDPPVNDVQESPNDFLSDQMKEKGEMDLKSMKSARNSMRSMKSKSADGKDEEE